MCVYINNILQLIINTFCSLQKTSSVAGLFYGEIQKFGILSNICRHTPDNPYNEEKIGKVENLIKLYLFTTATIFLEESLKKVAIMKLSKMMTTTIMYLVQYLSFIYDMHREHIQHTIPQLNIYSPLNSNCQTILPAYLAEIY